MKEVNNTLPNTQWSHDNPSTLKDQSTDKPRRLTRSRSRTTKRASPDSQQVHNPPLSSSKRSPPQAKDLLEPMEQSFHGIIIPGMPNMFRMDLAVLVAAAKASTEAMANSM